MSHLASTSEPEKLFPPAVDIVLAESCNFFDLSGKTPFTIVVELSRRSWPAKTNPKEHVQPIDVVTNGSLLDVSGVLKAGLLSLVEIHGDPPEQRW